MKRTLFISIFAAVCSLAAAAQQLVPVSAQQLVPVSAQQQSFMPDLSVTHPLPMLEPGIALVSYLKRAEDQQAQIASYKDDTVVIAELPDTKQKGEYQLVRTYTAQPKTLSFSNAKFEGDGFVKTNVIARLLQSEVDHVQKDNPADTAVTSANYRFFYKGVKAIDGHDVHEFQVKPRRKSPGLFKGHLFLDVHTGSLRRMEGSIVKSPSFFVKNLEFVQDFDDIDGFTFPTELHSSAKARIIGRTRVTVTHKDYQVMKATPAEVNISAQAMP